MNLLEFNQTFVGEDACEQYLIDTIWPEGFVCSGCESKDAWYIRARRTFECSQCNRQQSITTGTMFESSQTPLYEWFLAIYLVCESKKGISKEELARHLGMKDVRRAARLKQRIQEAMAERNSRYLLDGFVEWDEAVFKEAGDSLDVAVAVSVESQEDSSRPKYVRFQVLENMTSNTLESVAETVVSKSSDVCTDGHPSHNGFDQVFNEHIRCVQSHPSDAGEYLPWVHILISNAKRFIDGTHHSVNRLQGYLDEFTWRFNRRFCNLFHRMIVASVNYRPTCLCQWEGHSE